MAGLLHPVQHHDLGEVADMQTRSRRVIADIGGHGFLGEQFVETCLIGDLVNEAALIERAEEIGLEPGHNLLLSGLIFAVAGAPHVLSDAQRTLHNAVSSQ
ncbi:hypothetical protein D3C78_1181010 [compost metagenome]